MTGKEKLDGLYEAILGGKLQSAVELTKTALDNGAEPNALINECMIKAMEDVGARFEAGKAFVPELLLAARAMKGALDLIKPLLKGDESLKQGTVVIGTVKGDLHDIGKNLVASMFEGCGFEVVNIGTDADSDKFIKAVRENNADILCMSALLTTTMDYMREVIAALEREGMRNKVKVMIGGAPINEDFSDMIGADGYSSNANAAVALAKKLISG